MELGMTTRRSSGQPPTSRLNRRTPSETQTAPHERGAVQRSSQRCQRCRRSATLKPPTTHGRPAQGAASRAATLAWNKKLCTNAGGPGARNAAISA